MKYQELLQWLRDVGKKLPEAVELYLSYYRERGLVPPEPLSRVETLLSALEN